MLHTSNKPLTCSSIKRLLFTPSSKLASFLTDATDNSTWHLQEKSEFKLLTNFTIRLTNEMQALSQQSQSQKLVWSGWKEIIGGLISPIQGRNRWQSRRCRMSHFWCTKSRSSLPRISSLSTLTTLELSAFPSPSFHPLTHSFSLALKWWKYGKHTLMIMHLKSLNVPWFGLSGRITATYSDYWNGRVEKWENEMHIRAGNVLI